MNDLISRLPRNRRRGSKPRCHLLTHGSRDIVATSLTALISPWGQVRPSDFWMPDGFDNINEAQLHMASQLVNTNISKKLQDWWLSSVIGDGRTPNWDIASTCQIEGKQGLMLVEAKAHDDELHKETVGRSLEPNQSAESIKNHEQIGDAICEANAELNQILPGWNLSRDSHYQIVNRFAWSWKLAKLGVPVILVYLGFLNAKDMQDRGNIFTSDEDWRKLVLSHSNTIIPPGVWENRLNCQGFAFIPLIRTTECPLV